MISLTTADVSARLGLAGSGLALIFTTEYSALVGGGYRLDELVIARALMYLSAFVLFGLAMAPPRLNTTGVVCLLSVVACLSVLYYGTIKPAEGSYIFSIHPSTHVAAEMVSEGRNPYEVRDDDAFTMDMLRRFDMSAALFTRTKDGELVNQLLVYPAGHALAFVPAVWLGLEDIRWVSAGASIAVVVLIWLAAPSVLRPLAPLLLLLHPIATLSTPVILNVDAVWLLPLMLGMLSLSRRRFGWAAFFYGLAISIRLHPLLLAPFLAVLLWKEWDGEPAAWRLCQIAKVIGFAAAVFMTVNLPFLVWSPGDWLHGVSYAVLTAQQGGGGITEIEQLGIEPGRETYALLAGAAFLGLTVAYIVRFDVLKNTFWIFPAIVLWFTPRPLAYYTYPWMVLTLLAVILLLRERLAHDDIEGGESLEPVPVAV